MERVKTTAIILTVANLLCWYMSNPAETKENPFELRKQISTLEMEITELKEISSWTLRGELSKQNPPSEKPDVILTRLRVIAQSRNFIITETVNQGGEPVRIIIAGHGTYQAVTGLLNELANNKAILIEKIILDVREDNLIEAGIEALVRNGEWQGQIATKEKPEPITEHSIVAQALGRFDLFKTPVAQTPVITQPRARIRYLGFYSDSNDKTIIIEENGKPVVMLTGEATPAGNKVIEANEQNIDLISEKGLKWKVAIEKH